MGAVAARVGVSVSTLRSWEARYGLAPSGRTSGGHRRYTSADVARLQRLNRLVQSGVPTGAAAATVRSPVAPAGERARAARRDRPGAARQLQAAVDAFDLATAERLATRLLAEHGVVTAWTQVFTPVLQALGQRWQATGSGIECEHLGADLIQAALAEHRRRRRVGSATPRHGAVLAATPDEAHILPLRALAAALAEHGIPSTTYERMPAAALQSAVELAQPEVVVLFARSHGTADARALRNLAGVVPLLCAAGTGWRGRLPKGVTRAPDLPSALDLIRAATGHAAAEA